MHSKSPERDRAAPAVDGTRKLRECFEALTSGKKEVMNLVVAGRSTTDRRRVGHQRDHGQVHRARYEEMGAGLWPSWSRMTEKIRDFRAKG